jgi:hypothetical protein
MTTKINHNNKLIIILVISSVCFAGVLASLYFTFGNKSVTNFTQTENLISSISSVAKITKTFDSENEFISFSSSVNQTSQAISESKSSTPSITQTISSLENKYIDEVIGKELKLPVASNIEYNFDSKDKEIISKYIKTDYENKIISVLKDDKNSEIISLKIPKDKIDPQTQKDFPKTFKFSNEDRKTETKEAVFLYYTSEKRIAFLGNYVSNIQPFSYEAQDYWLVLYNGELVISKPNFSDWKKINTDDVPVKDLYKKSDFEFQVLKLFEYEDIVEYKIETISPQKYIIDGIFNQTDGD